MINFRSTAAAAVAATALIAGPAAAKDFCTLGVPGCSNTYGGVQQALDAAAADMATPGAGPDRVLIGSGTWIGNFKLSAGVTVEGSGQDTVLTQNVFGMAYGYPFVLDVKGQNAVVRNLRIKLPAGLQPRGLLLDAGASAENVAIDGAGAGNSTGVSLVSGARFSGKVDLPPGNNIGANMLEGSTVSDSEISGSPAVYAHPGPGRATVLRSRLVGHGGSAVESLKGALTLQDDLLDARDPGALSGLTTLSSVATPGLPHTVDLRNVTLLGHGDDPFSRGLDVRAQTAGDVVTVTARDSVVANFGGGALSRDGNDVANLSLDHVDVFPAASVKETGAGTFTAVAVTNADPAFGPDGFTPTPGSPLLDAATPGALDPGEPATDLLGNPRIVASGCGDARRDLGAVELAGSCVPPSPQPVPSPQPAADRVAPAITKVRLIHRRKVRFTLSETARVTIRIARAHHRPVVLKRSVAAGRITLKLRHALHRGRYRIRVTAVDAAGNRGTRAARTRVA